jgi:DNA polymerase I-like protein with 3'-5' exonuclease and polymerase domains
MPAANYGAIQTIAELEERFDAIIAAGKAFSFDIESGYDGPDAKGLALLVHHPKWKMVGFSFTNSVNWARYVPIAHDSGENIDDVYTAIKLLWKLLNTGLGVPHNASFELGALARVFREVLSDDAEVGEEVRKNKGFYPVLSDTMIEAFFVQEYPSAQTAAFLKMDKPGPGVGLKGLTKYIFDHEMTNFEDLFPDEDTEMGPLTPKSKKAVARFNTRHIVPRVVNYACEDAVWTLALHLKHYDKIMSGAYGERMPGLFRCEMQLLRVLAEMELEGIELDWDEYRRRSVDTKVFLDAMQEEIQNELSERLGELVSINLSSPKQVSEMLYERLKLPVKMRTATDAPSTGEAALRALAKKDEVIRRILEYREVKKLQGSYIDKYLNELSYAADGRAHANHKQNGAATGRFSVDHVSYQQWPKPYHYELRNGMTYDLNYRNFLIAPKHHRIVGYDFSQVELRVLAGMAHEEGLLQAFADGTDIHKATASLMMGIPLDDVTDKDRSKGKTLNFAVVYGSGAANIGELLGIPTEDAQKLLDQYFKTFSGLKGWMDSKKQEGHSQGFVETIFGRRYKVWEFEGTDEKGSWSKGDRMCVNAPVQGGAADYMKYGMVRVNKAIKKAGMQDKIKLVMTIHDALEFYVHESVTTQEVIDLVNPMVSFHVPGEGLPEIRADWHEGERWGEVFEIELDEDKQISGYTFKQELPDKTKVKWATDSYDELLEQFTEWKKNFVYVPVSQREPKPEEESRYNEVPAQELAIVEKDEVPVDTRPDWQKIHDEPVAEEPKLFRIFPVGELKQRHAYDFANFLNEREGGPHQIALQLGDREKLFNKFYFLNEVEFPIISDIFEGAKVRSEPLDVPVWAHA